ncbi:MAG: DUF4365 domain-containing protein [Dehalococcoidia bacterium]
MPRANQLEEFSRAYFHAVSATAGLAIAIPSVDHDSIDYTVSSGVGNRPKLDVQLKCTSRPALVGAALAYELPLKNYEELRIRTQVPRILVVVVVPPDIGRWTHQTERRLIMRKCAYWRSLRDYPDTTNSASVTIRIERTRILTPKALTSLMHEADEETR